MTARSRSRLAALGCALLGLGGQAGAGSVDYAVIDPALPSEYTRVPFQSGFTMVPAVTITNPGSSTVTNVVVEAQAIRNGSPAGTPLLSTPIPTLFSQNTAPAAFTGALPIDVGGTWSVRYTVTASETDSAPANNVVTSATLTAQEFELARDDGIPTGGLGIGAGNGGELGQQFDLPSPTLVRGIRFRMLTNGGANWVGQNIFANLRAYDSGANEPGALLFQTVPWIATAEGAVVDALFAAGPQLLTGRFVATVVEPAVSDATIQVGQTATVFTLDTTWVNWPTSPFGGWENLEEFGAGFRRAQEVSLLVGDPPDLMLSDGFEDPVGAASAAMLTAAR